MNPSSSVLAGFKKFDDLKTSYSGKFEPHQLKQFIGAEVTVSGAKNTAALRLEAYLKDIVEGSEESGNEKVGYIEYDFLNELNVSGSKLHETDVLVYLMNDNKNIDDVKSLVELRFEKVKDLTIILFPSEIDQFNMLVHARSFASNEQITVAPLLFGARHSGEKPIKENLKFGLTMGKGSIVSDLR